MRGDKRTVAQVEARLKTNAHLAERDAFAASLKRQPPRDNYGEPSMWPIAIIAIIGGILVVALVYAAGG